MKKRSRVKYLIFGFLLLFCLNTFSQKGITITVKGRIISNEDTSGVKNAIITLKDSKNRIFKDTTDNRGFYEFIFTKNFFTAAIVYADTIIGRQKPWSHYLSEFMDSDIGKIGIDDTIKESIIFKKDFFIQEVIIDIKFPKVLYRKNSTDYSYYLELNDTIFGASAIAIMTKILKEIPGMIIEINSHCSADETNAEKLSQERSEKLKADLIKNDINKDRIVAKGYGKEKLKVSDEQIKQAKTQKEKEALRTLNRRSVFKVLSWDTEQKK